MINKKIIILFSILSLNVFGQDKTLNENISPQKKVAKLCSEFETGKSFNYLKDFIERIKNEVLLNEKVRVQFAKDLNSKKLKGCENLLREYVLNMANKKDYEPQLGEQGLLSLAIIAGIPEANNVIEKEINEGRLSSWIDTLNSTDDKAYIKALNNWVLKIAKAIRESENSSLSEISDYGKIENENVDLKNPDKFRIWTPILMNRYLIENVKRKSKLNEEEFSNLNIIYGASTTSYREIFGDEIAKIARNNVEKWILSFRKEKAWVQFRLFPLMERIGGGEIKREVIWISKHHQSKKMRAIALSTLEKIAIKQR